VEWGRTHPHRGVKLVGLADGVEEQFFAIGTEKKVQHPRVQRLLVRMNL
jgi:LysR family transcriptional regulator, transcriptional activator of nhaA